VPLQTVRGQGSAVRTCGVVKDGHTAVFAVARIPICRTDGRRERFPCPSSASLINRARIRFSIQRAVQETLLRETHRPRLPNQHAAHTHPPARVVDRGNHIIIICISYYIYINQGCSHVDSTWTHLQRPEMLETSRLRLLFSFCSLLSSRKFIF
jgi:hypothetical protein